MKYSLNYRGILDVCLQYIHCIYIAQMPDSKINRQIESEAHKKLISRMFTIKVRC